MNSELIEWAGLVDVMPKAECIYLGFKRGHKGTIPVLREMGTMCANHMGETRGFQSGVTVCLGLTRRRYKAKENKGEIPGVTENKKQQQQQTVTAATITSQRKQKDRKKNNKSDNFNSLLCGCP